MNKRALYPATILSLGLALAWPVRAEYSNPDPAAACDLMRSERLKTRGYVSIGEGLHRCSTPAKKLMAGGEVSNTIKYYATGTKDAVTQLTLKLNVESLAEVQRSHQYLLRYTKALMKNALDQEVPQPVQDAILSATDGKWTAGKAEVVVKKAHIHATGYELLLTLR